MEKEWGNTQPIRLLIKKRLFSNNRNFTIKDTLGNDRFYAKGMWIKVKFSDPSRRLHRFVLRLYRMNGEEIALIEQEGNGSLARPTFYSVEPNNSRKYQKYRIDRHRVHGSDGTDWTIKSNSFSTQYFIEGPLGVVAKIRKPLFSRTYEIDISEYKNELLCLYSVLVLACIKSDAWLEVILKPT